MKILKSRNTLIIIPGLLILWKFLLFIDLPYPNYDGPWALSHTFSVLRGHFLESPFAYDFWTPYQLPPAYGFVSGLFFLILHPLSNVYSIFMYNIVLIILATILSNIYLDRKNIGSYTLRLIILVSLLTTTDIYNQRYELLNINLLLILLILLDVNYKNLTNIKIIIISFLTAVIGLIHPVGGFFAVCLSISIAVNRNFKLGFYVKNFLYISLFVAIIYLPIITLDFDRWYENFVLFYLSSGGKDYHKFDYLMTFKYFLISPFSFFPYFYLLISNKYGLKKILLEIGYLLIFLFLISLFGRYYYLVYIYVFIIWRISTWVPVKRLNSYAVLCYLCLAPLLTHFIPTASQLLNREYVLNFRNVINYINTQNYFSKYEHVYVSFPLSMPMIEFSNSRLLHSDYPDIEVKFTKNDIALIVNTDFFKALRNRFKLQSSDFNIEKVYEPVQEKFPLSIRSKFEEKHEAVGLWEVTLK